MELVESLKILSLKSEMLEGVLIFHLLALDIVTDVLGVEEEKFLSLMNLVPEC